ncbi:hypothetical protein H6501_02740 [Candidatus Woesearchaeota archaeon]|nr:hypothetical protein [Nanoarchaeota archaeon]MCB9370488.1 hypothetical protein [Candidatus Woesearchaeota archaeon]USN43566.1 MAG: hypothetical protein H6500_04185 [Candidatus Woesearchaeota archaeon]
MKIKQRIVFLFSSLFLFLFSSCTSSNGQKTGIAKVLTQERLLDFFKNMEWLEWVVYFMLIITVGVIIKQIGLQHVKKLNERTKTLISFFIAFMGVTGFVWVLIKGNVLPTYLVLFAGEILVLGSCVALLVDAFKEKKKK